VSRPAARVSERQEPNEPERAAARRLAYAMPVALAPPAPSASPQHPGCRTRLDPASVTPSPSPPPPPPHAGWARPLLVARQTNLNARFIAMHVLRLAADRPRRGSSRG
jgi:hypothetical protein